MHPNKRKARVSIGTPGAQCEVERGGQSCPNTSAWRMTWARTSLTLEICHGCYQERQQGTLDLSETFSPVKWEAGRADAYTLVTIAFSGMFAVFAAHWGLGVL